MTAVWVLFYVASGAACVATLMGNVAWFRGKDLLKKNGYKVNNLTHVGDFSNFSKLARETDDEALRAELQGIVTTVTRCVVVMVVFGAISGVLLFAFLEVTPG